MIYQSIVDTIGNTPLVKLNRIVEGIPAEVYAKVEFMNPGSSVKDRIAVKLIEDAESAGLIKPGGTIIEATSGNTGMGLALVCIQKGYQLICTTNDKQSKEKLDILRAMGAEVVVCPTAVSPDDPRSYYSVAKRLNEEIPNSYYPDQYNNLSNRTAHYEGTGPEIWDQTEGEITHFVVGVGTGGTISGIAKYLKEQNPNVQIWGVDTYGSVFKKYHETGEFDEKEIYPYITEGIGEDILPANVDFSLIDHFEKVSDKDGAIYARDLARKEGIFVGYSAGSAIAAIHQLKDRLTASDKVVVLFHDSGSRYVNKIFNDDWMMERGFLPKERTTAADLVRSKSNELISVQVGEPVDKAIELMNEHGISQIPVLNESQEVVGSITDQQIYNRVLDDPELKTQPVDQIMEQAMPLMPHHTPLSEVIALVKAGNTAVLIQQLDGELAILTKHDLISAMG